jgi:hypothetical protein
MEHLCLAEVRLLIASTKHVDRLTQLIDPVHFSRVVHVLEWNDVAGTKLNLDRVAKRELLILDHVDSTADEDFVRVQKHPSRLHVMLRELELAALYLLSTQLLLFDLERLDLAGAWG